MRIIFLITLLTALTAATLIWCTQLAHASEGTQITALVTRVVDGDTIDVEARPWPGMRIDARIRLPDIQAPEIYRPSCEAERLKGETATNWLRDRLEGETVWLSEVRPGKFGGRFIAQVRDAEGDVAAALVEAGIAKPWDGRSATKPVFCQISANDRAE